MVLGRNKAEPNPQEPEYTPAILDISAIGDVYIDSDGDINLIKKDGSAQYAIQYSKEVFNKINDIIDNNRKKTAGFVNNNDVKEC